MTGMSAGARSTPHARPSPWSSRRARVPGRGRRSRGAPARASCGRPSRSTPSPRRRPRPPSRRRRVRPRRAATRTCSRSWPSSWRSSGWPRWSPSPPAAAPVEPAQPSARCGAAPLRRRPAPPPAGAQTRSTWRASGAEYLEVVGSGSRRPVVEVAERHRAGTSSARGGRSGAPAPAACSSAPGGGGPGARCPARPSGSWPPQRPRSRRRTTSRRPDQVASIAQTLLSTSPAARPISRTTSSVRPVGTPEARFGHATPDAAAGANGRVGAR